MASFVLSLLTVAIVEKYFVHGYPGGGLMWNRNLGNFVPIGNVTPFGDLEKQFFRKSRELEIHDFAKKPLRLAYYEEPNIFSFYDNDKKATGVCGQFWTMLSDHLNFTMVISKVNDNRFGGLLKNGSYDGLVGMLMRREIEIIPRIGYYVSESELMHYTTPIWNNKYRTYIRPEFKADGTWMFHMFSQGVWCSLLFLLIFISIIGYKAQQISIAVSNDKKSYHNFHDHLFYTFATFCCQGFIPDSLYRRMKILSLTKKMFAWLVLMVLSSHLISYMTNRKVLLPFDDLETMFNRTKYRVAIFRGSMVFAKFHKVAARSTTKKIIDERVEHVPTPDILYEKACWGKKKYAIVESEDRQRAYGRYRCKLIPVGVAYFPTWIAAGVSKNFKYKRTIDIGMLRFNEFGLTDGLKDRWMESMEPPQDPNPMKPVTFEQVSMLFMILCLGMVASVVIFVVENYLFFHDYNRRVGNASRAMLLK